MTPAFELPAPHLGGWREGNTGTPGVWRFEGPAPGRAVMVTALVHGNELCGAWALLAALEAGLRPRAGVLMLALCNLQAFDRFNPLEPDASRYVDEDLNRVWGPGLRQGGARNRERARALELLPFVERADWLLDLHSMHEPGAPMMLTGLHERHVELARRLGTPAMVVMDEGHAEGLRLRDHGRFGAVRSGEDRALLIECGYHGALSSRAVAQDAMARFLVAAGTIAAAKVPPDWWLPLPGAQQVLEVTDAIVARSAELSFAQAWRSGQLVPQAGTLLGFNAGQAFVTPYADCHLVMPSLRQLRTGVTIMRLARARP